MTMIETKELKFELKDINRAGEFEGYASTRSKDAYGDIVAPKAFSKTLKESKGKVPILFMHDATLPVGLSQSMEEDDKGLFTKGMIDTDTELGTRVLSGMRKGYISEMSIGYKAIKESWDKEQNARILKEIKLLEYSMITKGFAANRDSVVTAVKYDVEDKRRLIEIEEQLKIFITNEKHYRMMKEFERELEEMNKKIAGFEQLLAEPLGSTRPFALPEPDESTLDMKKVVGSMDLPLADRGHEWNGPEAKSRIFKWAETGDGFDPKKAERAFFYVDSSKPEEKGSYKLPFTDVVDGKLVAIPRAISAVEGALNGARGTGVDIPDADKSAIMRKVESYKKRMGEEPKANQDVLAALQELNKFLRGEA